MTLSGNILPDSTAAPALQSQQRELAAAMRRDSIEKHLQTRPSPEDLIKEGILSRKQIQLFERIFVIDYLSQREPAGRGIGACHFGEQAVIYHGCLDPVYEVDRISQYVSMLKAEALLLFSAGSCNKWQPRDGHLTSGCAYANCPVFTIAARPNYFMLVKSSRNMGSKSAVQ